jgi:alpha-methylacyl-CoA racemase
MTGGTDKEVRTYWMEDVRGMVFMRQKMVDLWLCKSNPSSSGNILTRSHRGALEPQFFSILLGGLGIQDKSLIKTRDDRTTWPSIRELLTTKFKQKTRKDWGSIFDGMDACVTPVLSHSELEEENYDQRPAVTLRRTPFLAIKQMDGNWENRDVVEGQGLGVRGSGYNEYGLIPGEGGEETLNKWLGWKRGIQYDFEAGGLILRTGSKL